VSFPMTLSDLERRDARGQIFKVDIIIIIIIIITLLQFDLNDL